MLTNLESHGCFAILRISCRSLTSAALPMLLAAKSNAEDRGHPVLLVDLSHVRSLRACGLGALLELAAAFGQTGKLGYFAPTPKVAKTIKNSPVSGLLPIFATEADAAKASEFQKFALSGTQTVILCAGLESPMGPLCQRTPKPMLDFLGKPLLLRLLEHLQQFGLRDFLVNPGHLAPDIHRSLLRSPSRSVFFANEVAFSQGAWQPAPLGTASTLLRLHHNHSAFDDNFIVVQGDTLTNIDLPEMMVQHRVSDADVTIAATVGTESEAGPPGILRADSRGRILGLQQSPNSAHASCVTARTGLLHRGIYIVHPRALRHLPNVPGLDITRDLLPAILAAGARLQAYCPPATSHFQCITPSSPQAYFAALQHGLAGGLTTVLPELAAQRGQSIAASSSKIDPQVTISGPCYIGPGVEITGAVELEGPVVIGADAVIEGPSLIRNALIAPNTAVQPGGWIDSKVVGPDWSHPLNASAAELARAAPLDQVSSTQPATPRPLQLQRQLS